MKRGIIVLTIAVMFLLFLPLAFSAVWKECTLSLHDTIDQSLFCCYEGGVGTWQSDACCVPTGPDNNCNGIDDDCSGTADDGYVSTSTSCGVGACAASGATSCSGGVETDSCSPGSPSSEVCNDGIDNNCNGLTDCADTNCAGQSGPGGVTCCQTVSNCVNDDCKIESCTSNVCSNTNRPACDQTECSAGAYCDAAGGNCQTPDASSNVCLNCVSDTTTGSWTSTNHQDAGIAYGSNLFDSDIAVCSVASGGACFDNTGAVSTHKLALASGNCCGDDPSEWYKPGPSGGVECTSSVDDCVWSTGDIQNSDSGNVGWWCYIGEWDDCTTAVHIGKTHGSVKCAGSGTGWTLNPDPENTYGPNACTDGLDNDVDGLIDCADPDCGGTISGNVQDTDGQNIDVATVDALQDTTVQYTDLTNSLGNYEMLNVLCGTYDMVASKSGFVSSTKTADLPPEGSIIVNFTGTDALVSGTTCEADCTYAGDNTIHKECDGINGCAFYDETAKNVCNFAQPGWIREYSETQEIECAEGTPRNKKEVKATVTCEEENIIKLTKVVTYKGKLVRLVVVTCG